MGRDYVDVVYNEQDRPLTEYPDRLARYLTTRYGLTPGKSILDIGCGRGEFLRGFMRCGLRGFGVDQSRAASRICPEAELQTANLEREPLPFADDSFDYVFSKSVVEHFHDPERLASEIFRVLRPGGFVITMCPAWEYNYKIYFEDYTHRTPFMLSSLRDLHVISGFDDVQCEFFRQLPVLWAYPWMRALSEVVRLFAPVAFKKHCKFVRFSKEVMLLATARKPAGVTA